jgi:uncharacterized membrane protein
VGGWVAAAAASGVVAAGAVVVVRQEAVAPRGAGDALGPTSVCAFSTQPVPA